MMIGIRDQLAFYEEESVEFQSEDGTWVLLNWGDYIHPAADVRGAWHSKTFISTSMADMMDEAALPAVLYCILLALISCAYLMHA